MTRVLDIDLDVFVTPIHNIHADSRIDDDACNICPETDVKRFLENDCGLSRDNPMPGMIFEEHDEMFNGIKALVETGHLSSPFELVHVDAHADLGAGQWKPYEYLFTDLMHAEPEKRQDPTRGENGLNRGTVLLFLIACEWINKLHYVHHADDGKDFSEVFLEYESATDESFFQIPRCTKQQFDRWKPPFTNVLDLRKEWELGPRISFEVTPLQTFSGPGFDFVFLTRSPGFTPPKADRLFDLISEYINHEQV
ncbi:MAG: UPF0489 family protein [Fuerstiella sp.]